LPASDAPPPTPLPSKPSDDYATFLGEIVVAAREFGYDAAASPGRGDPRINGLRR
jgi:hypothetical protein